VDGVENRDSPWWEGGLGEQKMWRKWAGRRVRARRLKYGAWPERVVGMNINLSTEGLLTDSFGELCDLLIGGGLLFH